MSNFVKKEIKKLTGKGIHQRHMIEDKDHILVAVSGGKDSLSMLWLLKERIKRIPISYEITAVHVDPGFGANSGTQMEAFFQSNGLNYKIIYTNIGPMAHSDENRENPCFLCSRLRRKKLFELASRIGCNKIAFGHHKDDIIETFFLNIFYGASVSTMLPVQDFFNGELRIIRPLFMVDEDLISRYFRSMGWQEIDMDCPSSKTSKRMDIKKMLDGFYHTNKKIKGNIFHALHNVKPEYLL